MDSDQRRRLKAGASRQAKINAEHRRCPACGRGGGLGTLIWSDADRAVDAVGVRVCRYCGYERVIGGGTPE